MLKELKESMNKELKEIRKMIYKQNENTSKIGIIMKKKNSGVENFTRGVQEQN